MKQKNQKKVTILTVVLLFSSIFSPLLVYAEGQNAPSESQTSSSLIEENVKQEETQGEIIHNKTSDSTDLEEPEIPLEGSEVEEEGELEENTEEKSNESSSQDSIEADSNSESDAAKESEVKVIEEKVIQYAIRIKDSKLPIYSEKSSVEKPEKVSESDDYLNKLLYVEKEVLTNKDTWVLISLDGQVIGWINKEGTEEIDEPTVFSSKKEKTIVPSVFYSTHVQSKGWMPEVKDGVLSGTEGQKKRMEAIKINLSDVKGLGVKYSTHVQSYGWMDWVIDGKLSGTSNQAKRMEAIKIQLTGENAKNYDIYYRVYAESYGWLGWAKNGAEAGTSGLAKRLEAIQIVLVKKGEKAPGSTERPYIQKTVTEEKPSVLYSTHVQSKGWMPEVKDGVLSGTEGQKKRMEAIKINLSDVKDLGVKYSTHVQSYGWMDWVSDGKLSGTSNQAKRMEAIKIQLTGENAKNYDIYYRVHAESYGWLGWAKNGAEAGTSGLAKRLEAIQIVLVKKGEKAPGSTERPYIELEKSPVEKPFVSYSTHVQSLGWQKAVNNGATAGVTGKRIEGMKVSIQNVPDLSIQYSASVQHIGWMDWKNDGQLTGTVGQGRQMEAIKVKLSGRNAKYYDVLYRVYSKQFGWLGWAINGETAGTEGYALPAEKVEIKVVKKGEAVIDPSHASSRIFTEPSVAYSTHVQSKGWLSDVKNGALSGTTGEKKRIEAMKVSLQNAPFDGDISYRSYLQSSGWQNFVTNNALSGTTGKQKRLEAVEMKLTGDMEKFYDIYYRVHVESYGWLGWAKNGMSSGSTDLGKRVEAIEIKLVKKGEGESVTESEAFKQPIFVYVDPGHGGIDSGTTYGGVYEKNLNLQVALEVKKMLESEKYKVAISRTGDTFPSLSNRKNQANKLGTDIFVSIHHNSNNGLSKGIETFYYNQKGNTNNVMANNPQRIKSSKALATYIQDELIKSTKAVDRKVKTANFHVVRETKMPAVLTELGFVDNASDRLQLISPAYQRKLARAVVDGIDDYFGK